jgi:hypothetical protein
MKGPHGRRRPAWCSWHGRLSYTALLVRVTEEGSGGDNGMYYACQSCRTKHDLVPLAERP